MFPQTDHNEQFKKHSIWGWHLQISGKTVPSDIIIVSTNTGPCISSPLTCSCCWHTVSLTERQTTAGLRGLNSESSSLGRRLAKQTEGDPPNPTPEGEGDLRTVPNSGRRDTVTPRSNQESKQEKLRNRDKVGVRQGLVLRGESGGRGHAMGAESQVSEPSVMKLTGAGKKGIWKYGMNGAPETTEQGKGDGRKF